MHTKFASEQCTIIYFQKIKVQDGDAQGFIYMVHTSIILHSSLSSRGWPNALELVSDFPTNVVVRCNFVNNSFIQFGDKLQTGKC